MASDRDVDWKAWAEFLAAYVDSNHGKGISDRAWDAYTISRIEDCGCPLIEGGPDDGLLDHQPLCARAGGKP